VWEKIGVSEAVPHFGFEYSVGLEPIAANTQRMVDNFRQGVRDLEPIWEKIVQKANLTRVKQLAASEPHAFPEELWASVVYDFALAFNRRAMNQDHMLAFLPNVILMLAVLLAGAVVARILRVFVRRFLKPAAFDTFCQRSGLAEMMHRGGIGQSRSQVAGTVVYYLIAVITFFMALSALNL
jgi:hypothetical protein